MKEFEISSADLDKNIIIEASAGTGKTYSLEHLVVRYIAEKGYDISEILVVTFTKKATFELQNRIRNLLKNKVFELQTEQATTGKDSSLNTGLRPKKMNAGENKVYAKRVKEAFSRFAESQIYTIHGFCQYCIHNFPFESGVSFRTSIMNSKDIYKEAILDYLRTAESSAFSDFYSSFRKKYTDFPKMIELFISIIEARYILNENKNEIIPNQKLIDQTEEYCNEFLSGKGKLHNAIKQMSKCDFSPAILEEISKKMKLKFQAKTFETLSQLLKLVLTSQTVGEIFSDAFQKDAERLRKYSFDHLSKEKDTSILNSDELFFTKAMSNIFNSLELFRDSTTEEGNKYIYHNIASYIFIKNASLKIIEFAKQKKKNAAIFDFDDLVELTRDAVKMDNGNSALANELRRKYKVVLIDEFQDTDVSQWEIFSTIFKGSNHKIVLIGDPKQSIYRFRGGDLEVYFEAVNNLSDASAYRLATCYRSVDNIVKGINDIFSKVFSFTSGNGQKITYLDVKSCEDNQKFEKENSLHNGLPESAIEVIAIENDSDEKTKTDVETIIENIYGTEIISLLEQGLPASSIAILMETNKSCLSMYKHLKELGIPVMYEGEQNIFETCEAYQFVDLLYALSYPNDIAIVRKSLFSEFFALSAEDIIKIENSICMDRIAEKFANWSEMTAKGKLYKVLDEIFYQNNPVASLLTELVRKNENVDEENDINKSYISRTLEELGGKRKAANVMQIIEMLIVKNMKEKQDAASLLRYMISVMKGYEHIDEKSMRLENEPECVKIMTIHGSKGREFPVVFFSGGFGNSKPSAFREIYYEYIEGDKRYLDFSKKDLGRDRQFLELWEEKKRLYYVAMTRASKKLYIPILKNSPGTDLVSFYSSLVFDKLSKEFAENEMTLSIPVNTQKISLPKNMKVKEYNTILCNRLFELIEEFCKDKQYFKFNKIKTYVIADKKKNAAQINSEAVLSDLSCPMPLYKKEDVAKGFWIYSYSTLAKNKGDISAFDDEIKNLANPEKEEDSEQEDLLETEENIGIKGADFGNIMHKVLETIPYSKVLLHKDIDSAIADNELLEFVEQSARGIVNSDLAHKSRISVIKLLYKTLATPINAGGTFIRIGDIPESDRKHEVDFMFKIKQGKLKTVKEFNNFILEDGFIKGFIDMIFRLNGFYYIVDWKTNFLGTSINDYNQAGLENAMISNNYKLQMQLYTIALDMMLASEKENGFSKRDEKDKIETKQPVLGGSFYLFLRGLSGTKVKDARMEINIGTENKINTENKTGTKNNTGTENYTGTDNNTFYPGVYFSPPDYEAINKFRKAFLE